MSIALPSGWTAVPTVAPIAGPGGALVRVVGPGGVQGLAVAFRADLADHPLLREDIDPIERQLVAPGVPGVLPLVARDRDHAVFVYPTGDGSLLAEILARCSAGGVAPGERVAVELLARSGALLDLAWGASATVGVPNHGGLNPWRMVVYPDGDVAILGYGLPAVEVIAWLDGDTDAPPGLGLRYCPPERIDDKDEDGRSDLFALGMIAAEVALGRPPVDGDGQALVDAILSDAPSASLAELSVPVQDLIASLVALAPEDRPPTGASVSAAARALLHTLSGRTLGGLTRGDLDERVEAAVAPAKPRSAPVARPTVRTRTLLPEEEAGFDDDADTDEFSDARPEAPALDAVIAPVRPAFDAGPTVDVVVLDDEAYDAPAPAALVALQPERVPEDWVIVYDGPEPGPDTAHEPEPVLEAMPEPLDADDAPAADGEPAASDAEPEPDAEAEPDADVAADAGVGAVDHVERASYAEDADADAEDERDAAAAEDPDAEDIDEDVDADAEDADEDIDADAEDADEDIDVDEDAENADEDEPEDDDDDDDRHETDTPEVLYLRAVTVDLASQQILLRDGEPVRMSETQNAVLAYLAARPHQDVSREELWRNALGTQGSPESVRGIVQRLRKKIEQNASEPDHIVNVYGVGYRFEPPEEPRAVGPDPLPEPAATLYGRDEEIARVTQMLAHSSGGALVSVVGPPGSGAIQTALRAARELAAAGFEVHRCVVGGGEAVSTTLARGLGVRRIGRKRAAVLTEIARLLATREDLLVYLEAPHPHPTLRSTVAGLIDGSASSVLVACRSPLDLPGERCIQMAPLRDDQAIALFRERVAQVRPGAEIDDELGRAIVDHFDNMPAALEAAAARTEFFAPDALLERLDRGQALAEVGLDADLSATIERLEPVERAALEQCIVFRDGFDLAAAESVVRLPEASRGMITVLEALVARSLLRAEAGSVRWSVYETVRSQVRQTIDPDVLEETQQRHAATYGRLGLRLGGRAWVERTELAVLLRERENLQCAVFRGGAPAAGAALGLTALLGHEPAGPLCDAVDRVLVDRDIVAAGQGGEGRPWQIAAQLASARLQLYLGQGQKARSALRAATADGVLQDAALLMEVARLQAELGSTFEAEAALARVTTSDPWTTAVGATLRGRTLAAKAEPKKAERAFVEALHGFAAIDADIGTAHAQRHLAELRAAGGQARRAVALLEDAIDVFDEVGDRLTAASCRMRLAELLVGTGASPVAAAHLERVMGTARELSANGLQALARGVLGAVRAIEHDWDSSERLFFLALAGSAPEHARIQALFALALTLRGDADTAHEEAKAALPHPIAAAIVAALERQPAPHVDDEAYLLFQALEAWRAGASLTRIESDLADRASVAVRMVLACPRARPKRAVG